MIRLTKNYLLLPMLLQLKHLDAHLYSYPSIKHDDKTNFDLGQISKYNTIL